MYIRELYDDVLFENIDYEFKTRLDPNKTINWGKSIAAFANCGGGMIFVGAKNDGQLQGLTYEEIDSSKRLVNAEIELHLFPKPEIKFSVKNIDDDLKKLFY